MKTILLAEDDSFIVDIYGSQLRREGYKVIVAVDGKMALEKIRANYPDLVILDIGLPKMTGWEVLQELRNDPKTEHVNVIVISNYDRKNFESEIARYSVIKYFLKVQTTIEEIINVVKEITI